MSEPTAADRVLRWPRRVARAGLFLIEGAVADVPARGAQLTWIAENLITLAGVDVEVMGEAPTGVLVLREPCLISTLAVLARVPVDAVGRSLAQLAGLGRAAVLDAAAPAPWAEPRVLISTDDADELIAAAVAGTPITAVSVEELAPGGGAGGPPPGFLRAAARPRTWLRVRFDAAERQVRAA